MNSDVNMPEWNRFIDREWDGKCHCCGADAPGEYKGWEVDGKKQVICDVCHATRMELRKMVEDSVFCSPEWKAGEIGYESHRDSGDESQG